MAKNSLDSCCQVRCWFGLCVDGSVTRQLDYSVMIRWLDIHTALIADFVKAHTIWEGRIKYNDKNYLHTGTCGKVTIIN